MFAKITSVVSIKAENKIKFTELQVMLDSDKLAVVYQVLFYWVLFIVTILKLLSDKQENLEIDHNAQ